MVIIHYGGCSNILNADILLSNREGPDWTASRVFLLGSALFVSVLSVVNTRLFIKTNTIRTNICQ